MGPGLRRAPRFARTARSAEGLSMLSRRPTAPLLQAPAHTALAAACSSGASRACWQQCRGNGRGTRSTARAAASARHQEQQQQRAPPELLASTHRMRGHSAFSACRFIRACSSTLPPVQRGGHMGQGFCRGDEALSCCQPLLPPQAPSQQQHKAAAAAAGGGLL